MVTYTLLTTNRRYVDRYTIMVIFTNDVHFSLDMLLICIIFNPARYFVSRLMFLKSILFVLSHGQINKSYFKVHEWRVYIIVTKALFCAGFFLRIQEDESGGTWRLQEDPLQVGGCTTRLQKDPREGTCQPASHHGTGDHTASPHSPCSAQTTRSLAYFLFLLFVSCDLILGDYGLGLKGIFGNPLKSLLQSCIRI